MYFCICIFAISEEPSDLLLHQQKILLASFVEKLSDKEDWVQRGMTYKSGLVQEIFYCNRLYGDFQIQYLPPTTSRVNISFCKQKYEIRTRLLPRELKGLLMPHNFLFGEIDLATLPLMVKSIDLKSNRLTGPINLTGLPPQLRDLDLRWNRFSLNVVYYGSLPKGVEAIKIRSPKYETNTIKSIRPTEEEFSVEEKWFE